MTWYDYRTRFGPVGRSLDRFLFRLLIGWATAWSFDRLRLWIERGIPPEISIRMALIHALARLGIAFTWMWQGLVPKLVFPSIDEKTMISAAGLPLTLLPAIGAFELAFAAVTLELGAPLAHCGTGRICWLRKWPFHSFYLKACGPP